jgi:hypothetical protein
MTAIFRHISKHISERLISANKSIHVAVAWFTNESLFDILLDKVREGVNVELIINNDHINNHQNGLDFNEFIRIGGKLYFADTSRLMHHKFLIIDNLSLISGSYNWTYNAEYRNTENIILFESKEVVERFEEEFYFLKSKGEPQLDKITIKSVKNKDYDEKEYLKNDYYCKSIAEERNGNLQKSLKAIQTAQQIDQTDMQILERIDKVKEKIKKPLYNYHVEDGQFWFEYDDIRLLGKEGDIITTYQWEDFSMPRNTYILYIEGFHVECIGDVERSFPKNKDEHDRIKRETMKSYEQFE